MAKPILDIDDPLDVLVDNTERLLAGDASVFHRSGELVQIENKTLRPIRMSLLRYLMSRACTWTREGKPIHPPTSIARCLMEKSGWDNVRPVKGISPFPPMSPKGNLITKEGYDEETGIYYTGEAQCQLEGVPDKRDAQRSIQTLLDIISGFPFASEAHQSAWLAGLLSPLARYAHNGNTPLVLIQANAPRVGKTRLAKLVSFIITGEDCAVVAQTKNEEEERKRIMTYLRTGKPMVLVDNIVGQYGNATINALATSRFIEDRVLGQSKLLCVPNDTCWFLTGNNVLLAPDTAERCLHIRLMCQDEKPHLRDGFKYADLFSAVQEKRTELLTAALTILQAYIKAGMPKQKMDPWGSFEEWSRLIRGALMWAGMPDPAETRAELEVEADIGKDTSCALIDAWFQLQISMDKPCGFTAKEAFGLLPRAPNLQGALEDITNGKRVNAHVIGRHLREIRDRNYNGKVVKCIPNEKMGHRWQVAEL